ncbi:hypoxanthine-guanine phosphoribosyltransferase-like [Oppia nitens]|uniref:hypoxanthine-guanine phosphoribosyltransferase-like n=1 Tax=Oppia nitens TaxID=1686743 RepID=UPI0023DC4F68|nr:hypoxanthine-guanine phosphoribosyltransferase-like [Oppia nitens]
MTTNLLTKSQPINITDDFPGYPIQSFNISPHFGQYLERVLIPGGLIQDRIERLACDVAIDMGDQSFTAVCVLKGGHQFFSQLLDQIKQFYRYRYASTTTTTNNGQSAHLIDQRIGVEFIRVKSYENDSSTQDIRITGIESLDALRGQNILIVEDIIDTGKTMQSLLKLLDDYQLKSCRVISLFVKRTPLSNGYRPDYIGFEIPNSFIVGYNMDYNERFRELNHVCLMSETGKQQYRSLTTTTKI